MLQALILARRQGPLVVVCIIVMALVAGGYARGRASGKAERDAHWQAVVAQRNLAEAKALADAIEQERMRLDVAALIERRHLEEQLKRAQEKQVVTKVVKEYVRARPDLGRCDIDADGLRLWNAANAGKPPRGAGAGKRRSGAGQGRS